MNWREEYGAKCRSAAEALELVESGDRVWIQSGCGTPSDLVDALVGRAAELRDVEIGRSANGLTVIRSGVQADETVVTDGQLRLVPGARVEPKLLVVPTDGVAATTEASAPKKGS